MEKVDLFGRQPLTEKRFFKQGQRGENQEKNAQGNRIWSEGRGVNTKSFLRKERSKRRSTRKGNSGQGGGLILLHSSKAVEVWRKTWTLLLQQFLQPKRKIKKKKTKRGAKKDKRIISNPKVTYRFSLLDSRGTLNREQT